MSIPPSLENHVALITGANHGIGAAIARRLAESGFAVVVSYLRLQDELLQGDAYPEARASSADAVVSSIVARGGRAVSIEADLRDPGSPTRLFDFAEQHVGSVDILINNATGWVADTFKGQARDRLNRALEPMSPSSFDQVFGVDARGSAHDL
jgi:3-oxoacyl-[acyl-carrier protein] reductase